MTFLIQVSNQVAKITESLMAHTLKFEDGIKLSELDPNSGTCFEYDFDMALESLGSLIGSMSIRFT